MPSFIVADRLALIAMQRMGARMAATGLVRAAWAGRRNRSWPEALKREISAASYAKGNTVASVGISPLRSVLNSFRCRAKFGMSRFGLEMICSGARTDAAEKNPFSSASASARASSTSLYRWSG